MRATHSDSTGCRGERPRSSPSSALLVLRGPVADGLDVVAVGVEDEGAVVARVIDGARSRGTVVGAPSSESSGMESVDRLWRAGAEGDMGAADGRALASVDPEEWKGSVLGVLPEPGGTLDRFHQQPDPEWLEGLFVESLAAGEVAGLEADMIEHWLSLACLRSVHTGGGFGAGGGGRGAAGDLDLRPEGDRGAGGDPADLGSRRLHRLTELPPGRCPAGRAGARHRLQRLP